MVLRLGDFSETRMLRSPDGGGGGGVISNVGNTTSELVRQALESTKTSPKSFILGKIDGGFFDVKFDSNTKMQNIDGLSFLDIAKVLYFCHVNNKTISETLKLLESVSNDNWVKKFLLSISGEILLSEVIRFYF